MKQKKIIKILIPICILCFSIIIITKTIYSYRKNTSASEILLEITEEENNIEETSSIAMDLMFEYDYKNESLENILLEYMNENDLNESNFSLSYYNFITENSYYFNETTLMFAASTYKLPLNMYFYDLISEGTYTDNSLLYYYDYCNEDSLGYIYENYQYGDYIPLQTLQYQSIVNSDNISSWILFSELGGWNTMMEAISAYSSQYYIYSYENYFNTGFMLDCLKQIYENENTYSDLITNMSNLQSDSYLSTYLEEIMIANKYGNYGSAFNDVGIVYCDTPYAIAIYTDTIANGANNIAEINRIIYEYNMMQSH